MARQSPRRQTRWFALAEIGCILCCWLALVALVGSMTLKANGVELPVIWMRFGLPILISAVIGYFTNFVAVTMLFRPYGPDDRHWVRWLTLSLWRQGLAPARKMELAQSIGHEVSARLLTPEIVTEEISQLVAGAINDERFRGNVRYFLGPILRKNLPIVIERMTPEILSLLRQAVTDGLRRDHVKDFVEKVIEPWMNTSDARSRFVDAVVRFLQEQTPSFVGYLQEAAADYRRKSASKRFFLGVAEAVGALDWNEVADSMREQLASRRNRDRLVDALADVTRSLRERVDESDIEPLLETFQMRSSDYLSEVVEGFLANRLPEAVNRLVDNRAFWRWLTDEGLPAIEPEIVAWLRGEGIEIVGKRFDVAGRVRAAIERMDVVALHEMVDRVSAEQLGAIQVLGFALGLAGGIALVIVM